MKLCIATSSYPSEGENSFAGIFIRDFARELVHRGVDVSIFSQDTGQPPRRDKGIEVITFPWPGGGTPLSILRPYFPMDALNILLLLTRGTKRLVQHCQKEKVDFLLAMWVLPAGHWAMGLQRTVGIPVAVWSLGSDIWIYGRLPVFRLWVRKILRLSTYCFADGLSLSKEVSLLSGKPCCFLPTTRILPKEGLPVLSLDPGKSHYLFIGRYHKNKGPDILLEAIRRIDRKILPNMQFHFFGTGPLEGDLKRRILQYDLKGYVSIQGPIGEHSAAAFLKKCDALIIPSRVESIPVILSDALQLDCRLVVTDVGDMGRLVRDYKAGVVVEKPSPEALKEAIQAQLNKKEDEFKEGRKRLYALFDLEASVDTFLKTVGMK